MIKRKVTPGAVCLVVSSKGLTKDGIEGETVTYCTAIKYLGDITFRFRGAKYLMDDAWEVKYPDDRN